MRSNALRQKEKMTGITKEIVTRYEIELEKVWSFYQDIKYHLSLSSNDKLRITLANTQEEIAHEHKKRQYIEEKIRKTFLQGMTTMSLETMQLFNHASSTSVKSGPFYNNHNQDEPEDNAANEQKWYNNITVGPELKRTCEITLFIKWLHFSDFLKRSSILYICLYVFV